MVPGRPDALHRRLQEHAQSTFESDPIRMRSLARVLGRWADQQSEAGVMRLAVSADLPDRKLASALNDLWDVAAGASDSAALSTNTGAAADRQAWLIQNPGYASNDGVAERVRQKSSRESKTAPSAGDWYADAMFPPRPDIATAVSERVRAVVSEVIASSTKGLDPDDFQAVFSVIAAVLAGTEHTVMEELQSYLNELQERRAEQGGRGFANPDRNAQFATELSGLLLRTSQRIACPSCGEPSLPRVNTTKNQTGTFDFHHDRTSHGGGIQMPRLRLCRKAESKGRRI
jgi:hypothetical protein